MANFLESIKRFLSNKNTVTILGVIAGVLVLYIGYNMRVTQAVKPVVIPYALEEIPSRTLITEELIGYMEVPNSVIKKSPNILKNSGSVLYKYARYGITIPANSFFYSDSVMDQSEIPDSAFADIKDGYTIFSLPVDLHTTYGNSIVPNNYIDLYFKANETQDRVIFGKLIESIEVLEVKDSSGNQVFETNSEARTPSEILFAVPDDMYLLLMKASYIDSDVEIIPVPRNESYSLNPSETIISSDYIRNFILSKATTIPENMISSSNNSNNSNSDDFEINSNSNSNNTDNNNNRATN